MLHFRKEDYDFLRELPVSKRGEKTIVIHTGASWKMMQWEREKWISLLEKIHAYGLYKIVFVGAGNDETDYQYIASRLSFPVHSLIGRTDLLGLTLFLQSADYFIGIDSGPGNLAHLVNLRSIIIYGPGPHMYLSSHPEDIIMDKSNGRGFRQRFFLMKHGFIHQIGADEVCTAFKTLQGEIRPKSVKQEIRRPMK